MLRTCGTPDPSTRKRRSPLPSAIRALLHDPRDDEERDKSTRAVEKDYYRDRSADLWSIILSAVNHHWLDSEIAHLIEEKSTLSVLVEDRGESGEHWLAKQIDKAREHVRKNPAIPVTAINHMKMTMLPEAELSYTELRVLGAHQRRCHHMGDGKYTSSYPLMAIDARVSEGTAHKTVDKLVKAGWSYRHATPPIGSGRATQYNLRIPGWLKEDYNEMFKQGGGVGNEPSPPHKKLCDWLASTPTPPFATYLGSNAFYASGNLLGVCVPVLQALYVARERGEGYLAVNEVARRLGKDRSNVKDHLKRLHLLVDRDDQSAVQLRGDWKQTLAVIAREAGGAERAMAQRERDRKKREDRQAGQLDFALEHGVTLRSDLVEAKTAINHRGALDAHAFVNDVTGNVHVLALRELPLPIDPELVGAVAPMVLTYRTSGHCQHLAHQDGAPNYLTRVQLHHVDVPPESTEPSDVPPGDGG